MMAMVKTKLAKLEQDVYNSLMLVNFYCLV